MARLSVLKDDYRRVTGRSFKHFYCPIMYRDDDAVLCQGHIVNQAFPEASPRWEVQRKDIDGFFGTNFEAEFTDLRYRGAASPIEAAADSHLARRLGPKILRDGDPVEFYRPRGEVPPEHTRVTVPTERGPRDIALKIGPGEMEGVWTCEVAQDVRLGALVSLLKTAHLTLFRLLGYRYALSPGGHLLGHDILGRFYLECQGLKRPEIREAAMEHFREFVHLVRPAVFDASDFAGTIEDQQLWICADTDGWPWALIVLVRTGPDLHAVLTPSFETPEGAARFLRFTTSEHEHLEIKRARFTGDAFVGTAPTVTRWAKDDPALDLRAEIDPFESKD